MDVLLTCHFYYLYKPIFVINLSINNLFIYLHMDTQMNTYFSQNSTSYLMADFSLKRGTLRKCTLSPLFNIFTSI